MTTGGLKDEWYYKKWINQRAFNVKLIQNLHLQQRRFFSLALLSSLNVKPVIVGIMYNTVDTSTQCLSGEVTRRNLTLSFNIKSLHIHILSVYM